MSICALHLQSRLKVSEKKQTEKLKYKWLT